MAGMHPFVALDFETANASRDSACALGLVKIVEAEVVAQRHYLIRPPSSFFHWFNVEIHGITWEMVQDEPTIGQQWTTLSAFLADAHFLVAHNASFDRGVMRACCQRYGVTMPPQKFLCTVSLARQAWPDLESHRLNVVSRFLQIPLKHHDAASDALACAHILLQAMSHRPELRQKYRDYTKEPKV